MIIGIVGPSASSKSEAAKQLVLSGMRDCVTQYRIINADSQQVYADLGLLCAMPEFLEHHVLYGFANEPINAVKWAELAVREIDRALVDGVVPVLVGGTGMYFKILLEGVAVIPSVDAVIQEAVGLMTYEELRNILSTTSANSVPKDRRRMERAVGVFLQTNRYIEEFGDVTSFLPSDERFKLYSIMPSTEEIWSSVERRLDNTLDDMVAEVQLYIQKCSEEKIRKKVDMIGFAEICEYLAGRITRAVLRERILYKTRRYTKRQKTYIRNCLQVEREFSNWELLFEFVRRL